MSDFNRPTWNWQPQVLRDWQQVWEPCKRSSGLIMVWTIIGRLWEEKRKRGVCQIACGNKEKLWPEHSWKLENSTVFGLCWMGFSKRFLMNRPKSEPTSGVKADLCGSENKEGLYRFSMSIDNHEKSIVGRHWTDTIVKDLRLFDETHRIGLPDATVPFTKYSFLDAEVKTVIVVTGRAEGKMWSEANWSRCRLIFHDWRISLQGVSETSTAGYGYNHKD